MGRKKLEEAIQEMVHITEQILAMCNSAADLAHLELLKDEGLKKFQQDAHRKTRKLIQTLDDIPVT